MRYLILSFFLFGCSVKDDIQAVSLNNNGVELLQKESPKGAQENFIDALALKPFEASLHSNLGVSLDQGKEIDKAIQAYTKATEEAKLPEEQFIARFNLAQAIAKKGQIEPALNWYQKALEVKPDSIETKTNIELLTQRQKGGGGGEGENENQEQNQDENQQGKNDKKEEKKEPQQYGKNPKPQPRQFKGELSEADVKKILGELKQQEQRIRADFNRKDMKEQPRDKDW